MKVRLYRDTQLGGSGPCDPPESMLSPAEKIVRQHNLLGKEGNVSSFGAFTLEVTFADKGTFSLPAWMFKEIE